MAHVDGCVIGIEADRAMLDHGRHVIDEDKKRSGPRMDPCGTPVETALHSEQAE